MKIVWAGMQAVQPSRRCMSLPRFDWFEGLDFFDLWDTTRVRAHVMKTPPGFLKGPHRSVVSCSLWECGVAAERAVRQYCPSGPTFQERWQNVVCVTQLSKRFHMFGGVRQRRKTLAQPRG